MLNMTKDFIMKLCVKIIKIVVNIKIKSFRAGWEPKSDT